MFASGSGFSSAYQQLPFAFCVQPSTTISRSNFSLATLDTSPRNSRVFIPDFPSPSGYEQSFNCSLPASALNYASQTSRPRLMNSNDSLNNDHQMSSRGFRVPDSQQIMDPNEIARSSGFVPPVLSSPAMSRREFVPQSGYISAVPPPQHGKMLVDPQTGQQYFVATNAQPHQVAYYPVFYNTAAPPPIQQHVYYAPAPQPHQWIGGAMPSPPVSSSHQPNFLNHPYPHQQYPTTTSSYTPAYHVEIPPSSSVSVCDDRGISPNNVYFQRNHESRMSTESANSGNNQSFQPIPFQSDDSMSPIPPQTIPRNASSSNQSTVIPAASQSNPLMEHSARYSTASSATSGFVSGAGESTADTSANRPNALSNLRTTFNKPKLYGAPEWWGEESSPELERSNKKVENDRTPTQTQKKLDSPTSKTLLEKIEAQNEPRAVVAKPIRMEIDLSRPLSPEHKKPVNNDQKTASRAPPTAFTIDFSNNEPNSARRTKPPPVLTSQQDSGRRSSRRSAPPNQVQLPQSNSQQDTKHYLFSKMVQGFSATSTGAADDDDDQHTTLLPSSLGDRRDIDAISEAGTYTIDDKNKFRHHNRSRQFSDASSTSSASSSTATNQSNSRPQPSSARSNATNAKESGALSSARSTNTSAASPHFAMRRSLMKDLQDLKNQQLAKPTPSQQQQQPKARTIVDPLKSSRLCATTSTQKQATPTASPRTTVTNQAAGFRRSDGGRFSMRTGGTPAPSTKLGNNKPPFRAGIAPSNKKQQINSGTPEMANWLRRKGYDPRKSVAEERKMQQLKERSDTFFANRSVSYNQPAYYSGFRKLLKPIDDERSNISQSQDDLSRLREEEDEEFEGSNSNLTKTVDELTKKCQRSMQLLKLCNPNALTESVEHLLDQIVDEEGSENGDSAIGRLERLNEAFGALQKCLEDNSSSRNSSPQNMSATIKQRILSPTTSAPPFDSPEEF